MPRTRTVPSDGGGPNDLVASAPTSSAVEAAESAAEQPKPQPAGDLARHEHDAGNLRTKSAAIWHHAAMASKIRGVDPESYILYHERLLADCGNPTDPIEQMLIQQLAQAHFSLGLLFAKTSNGGHVQAVGIYAGATARLMAEFQRSSLALQAYRAASRQLAHDPTKDIVIPDVASNDDPPGKTGTEDELIATTEACDAGEPILPYPGPATLGDQPPQSAEVAHDRRRKGKGPRRRVAT